LIGAANRQRIAIESIETSEWHIAPSFDPGRFGDDASLHRDLVDLLSDDARLKQSIEELISLSVLSEVSRDGLQAYACRDETARASFDQNRAYWIHRAFELCCHVFPQSQILDSS
jgi:hypothetical protein